MRAADVMRHRVVTVGPDCTVAEAAVIMLKHGVSGLPVVDTHGALVGVVTEGDLLRRHELGTERKRPRWLEFLLGPGRLASDYAHAHGRKIQEVMTPKVFTIEPSASLEALVGLMERHRIKRLPVVENGKLVGIVSRADLLGVLAHIAPLAPKTLPSDADIRRRILGELDAAHELPRECIDAIVTHGEVELRGVITDERQRQAIKIVAENVEGVRKVIDHLVWVEPLTGMTIPT